MERSRFVAPSSLCAAPKKNDVPSIFVVDTSIRLPHTNLIAQRDKRKETNMTNLLTRLNALRVANDMKPLKHAPSKAKMEEAIKALMPKGTREKSPVAEYARSVGVDPKVTRALLRRHFETPANGNWELTKEVKAKIDEQAARAAA